jgi:hypothetical protein
MLRTAARRIWKLLRWPVFAIAALLLIAVAFNAVDEDVAPLTTQMLTRPANSLADSENLHVLLAGLDAPAGHSMFEQGIANTRAINEAVQNASHSSDVPFGVGKTPESTRYAIDLGFEPWRLLEDSLWDRIKRGELDVATLTTKYAEALTRYRQLHSATGYHELISVLAPFLTYHPDTRLRHLYLAQVAYELQSGQADRQQAALEDLSRDFSTWLRMLRGEGPLITKMLAVAYLHTDLLLLGDAAADPAVSIEAPGTGAREMLELVPIEDWQIASAWRYELQFQAESVRWLSVNPADFLRDLTVDGSTAFQRAQSRAASYFYLPNQTLNISAKRFDELTRITSGPVDSLDEQLSSFNERAGKLSGVAVLGRIRNPIGKMLLDISTPAYSSYVLRSFDAAAYQRAVRLAYELRRTGTDSEGVERFLQSHPEWSSHPADNKPFTLNDTRTAIVVRPLGNTGRQRRFDARLIYAQVHAESSAPTLAP